MDINNDKRFVVRDTQIGQRLGQMRRADSKCPENGRSKHIHG